ncbi:MAG: YkgJ family cysteine cluster protein [Desulfobacterales bacterium]|nr:YkgJ family cysteine cluster protein [Desulfobacterales bacterium]
MRDPLQPFAANESFQFECTPRVACFNACCRDLVQALTPYDALRLRRGLGLTSGRFLAQFTRRHTGPGSGLPVATLIPADRPLRRCPFVTESGCGVYPDRPASCRIYPLVRSVCRSRATGELTESFYLLREPHCRGFEGPTRQRVDEWVACQGLSDYNRENDRLLELIALKNRRHPGPLSSATGDRIFTALYDADAFRAALAGGRLPGGTALCEQFPGAARGDDLALLHAGLAWARHLIATDGETA